MHYIHTYIHVCVVKHSKVCNCVCYEVPFVAARLRRLFFHTAKRGEPSSSSVLLSEDAKPPFASPWAELKLVVFEGSCIASVVSSPYRGS